MADHKLGAELFGIEKRGISRHITNILKDRRKKLDAFLLLNNQKMLQDAGKGMKKIASKLAEGKYEEIDQHKGARKDPELCIHEKGNFKIKYDIGYCV